MDWGSLIYVGIGIAFGYAICLGRHAQRRIARIEHEAMSMHATMLRSFAERMSHSAQVTADSPAESEEEQMFRMGMAKGQELLAKELSAMADRINPR